MGNRDVDWSLGSEPDGRKHQLQVRFAEPLSGIHRTLQISAIAPLVTDATWQLPAIRPPQSFWRQGTLSLQLSAALTLRHLSAQQAIQTAQSPVAARSDTTRQFQMFTAGASLQVNAVRSQPSCSAIIGTTIDVEPGSVTGLVMADFACQSGQHYVLTASVPNSWMIDGVETVPAEALQDHQFVAFDQHYKRLLIRLAQPLTAAAPLRLQVRAHARPRWSCARTISDQCSSAGSRPSPNWSPSLPTRAFDSTSSAMSVWTGWLRKICPRLRPSCYNRAAVASSFRTISKPIP